MAEYISREAIIKELEEEIEAGDEFDEEDVLINEGLKIAIKDIKNQSAADVQPVRYGRWELTNNPSFRKCSECGAWWSSDITDNCFTNYCPKCGARMNLKDGDTNG